MGDILDVLGWIFLVALAIAQRLKIRRLEIDNGNLRMEKYDASELPTVGKQFFRKLGKS
jgi:hypothetical protein